jgi:L,D-transpeptidase YbiS
VLQIDINLAQQKLILFSADQIVLETLISSAKNGVGERFGSNCTPRGLFKIKLKIGHNCAENTVFVARRVSGEIYSPELALKYPHRDWILTRILWLTGLEPGKNRYGNVDTLRRFIYIHGCPPHYHMGRPESQGCIRMRNAQLIQLFDAVQIGTTVFIHGE